jgi:hypothetical protein
MVTWAVLRVYTDGEVCSDPLLVSFDRWGGLET